MLFEVGQGNRGQANILRVATPDDYRKYSARLILYFLGSMVVVMVLV
jgi:hypothetical protein